MNKQEAEQRFLKAKNEHERLFDIFLGYKKSRSSGEISEQEYREKAALIGQQQRALRKEYFTMGSIARYGVDSEDHQSV